MKNFALLLTSLALCCPTAHAASAVTYSGNTLRIPHVSYKDALYDVIMTFEAPDKLILVSAEPLATAPDFPVVKVSDELKLNLSEIMVGSELFRADIAPKDMDMPGNEYKVSDILPSFVGKIFPGEKITGLGVLEDNGFDGFSWKPRLSDDGKILAAYANKEGVSTPVLFSDKDGQLKHLKTFMDEEAAWPEAVNNNGNMAGYGQINTTPDNTEDPVKIDNAYYTIDGTELVNIGTLDEGKKSKAFGLNNSGMVVGWSTTTADDGGHSAFKYDANSNQLSTLTGEIFKDQLSFAFDINDAGQIAGVTTTAEGTSLAFIYKDGETKTLGSFDDSGFSEARAINDKGWTTGFSDTADAATFAFIHDGTTMTKITGLNGDSRGDDINTHGHVVGTYTDAVDSSRRLFIYKDGKASDLYDLLPAADKANWKDFTRVQNIADDGTISGSGRFFVDKATKKWLWMAFTMKL